MNYTRFLVLGLMITGCVARANIAGTGPAAEEARAEEPRSTSEPADAEQWPAGDWTLAERSSWKRIHKQMDQHRNLMNTTCGTEVTAVYVYEDFRDRLAATDANHGEEWNVGSIFGALRNICLEGEDEKATVAAKVREVVFARAPKAHGIADGVLTVGLDLEANPRQFVNDFTAWLRSSL